MSRDYFPYRLRIKYENHRGPLPEPHWDYFIMWDGTVCGRGEAPTLLEARAKGEDLLLRYWGEWLRKNRSRVVAARNLRAARRGSRWWRLLGKAVPLS